MNKKTLDLLSDIYKNVTTTHLLITDKDFNILYSNDSLMDKMNITSIRPYLDIKDNQTLTKNVIIPLSIHNYNYSSNILPITENDEIDGYLIRLITYEELLFHQLNKDMISSELELFASMRQYISGIVSISSYLHYSLEKAEMYEDLKYINQQTNYCYKLLALTLNKNEIAKYSYDIFNKCRIDLKTFLGDIVFIINTILRSNQISINFRCTETAVIVADPDRLVNMLLCLIINAIQYNISEKKEITIAVTKSETSILLSVADNGIGMNNSTITDLFKNINMQKNDNSNAKKSGLGFYIVNYFCKTFGANMIISSRENTGSTITLKFPLQQSSDFPVYMASKTAEYFTNRYSNIYISLSQVTDMNFL